MKTLVLLIALFASIDAFSAITLRTDVNSNSANVIQTTGIALTAVSDGVSDDLILIIEGWSDNNGVWDVLSGFTEIVDRQEGGGADRSLGVQYKKHSGSEPASYTITGTDVSIIDNISGLIGAFDGVDTTTPIDAAAQTSTVENDTTPTSPAITTVTNGAWVVIALIFTHANVTAFVAPTGYTLIGEKIVGTDSNTGANIAFAYKEIAVFGTETPGAWTATNASGGDDSIVATIAIRPAAAGGGSIVPILVNQFRKRRL